jgi:phosphoribosyl 1,2-cyclic phosphate phosphodiesterase
MTFTLTILGCGSSAGVPRIGGDWGVCDSKNPKNRRRRCSVLLERKSELGTTSVLVDTSPDMREQMLSAEAKSLDAVWYTHEHADHTHGIDELRAFFLLQRKRIPVWADAPTAEMLLHRFSYCFQSPAGSDYPPIASLHAMGTEIVTDGAGGTIRGTPIEVQHGNIKAQGFRWGNLAYTPDVNDISPAAEAMLQGLDMWVVDALRRSPHPTHFSLQETLEWIARIKPKQAVLTNMHIDLDYEKLCKELPDNIRPAYDGMKLNITNML